MLVPGVVLQLLGVEPNGGTELIGRVAGGMLIAVGSTLLGTQDEKNAPTRRQIALGNAFCDGALAVVFFQAAQNGLTRGAASWMVGVVFVANGVMWLGTLPRKEIPSNQP